MFVFRLIGGALIVLTGWWTGWAISARLTERRLALAQTLALISLIKDEIQYRRTSLNEIYNAVKDEKRFSMFMFSSERTMQELQPPSCFSKEEKDLFRECFLRLGYKNSKQECERLMQYEIRFTVFLQTAATEEGGAAAMNQKMGLAIGGMIALVLM